MVHLRPLSSAQGLRMMTVRYAHTERFSSAHLRSFFPRFPMRLDATLGEVYEGMWASYKHRMIYPVLLWAGVCYHFMWNPYASEHAKEEVRARERKLKSLEFHQD